MANRKLYILKIEINGNEETCESLSEEFIFPELSLVVDEIDLVDYFDDEAINLCLDCEEVGLT